MQNWLMAIRAVHFASVISLAGVFLFVRVVAAPAFGHCGDLAAIGTLRRRLFVIAWASAGAALASGALWLVLEAESMSAKPLGIVLSQGIAGVVLLRTRFGHDWLLRLAFGAPLLTLLAAAHRLRHRNMLALLDWTLLAVGAALLGSLAWAGHGGADEGWQGRVHLVADVVHLLAAGAWLGALLPLGLLFAWARRADGAAAGPPIAWIAARRFSALGIAAVGTLLGTGIVNTLFLAGTIPALLGTLYGQLLLVKIGLFSAMVGVAAVNRLRLAPRLAGDDHIKARFAIGQLQRNAAIETGLGAIVLAIVGMLGTLPPGLHTQPWWPLPFRLDLAALDTPWTLALLAVLMSGLAVETVVAAIVGRRRRMAMSGLGLLIVCAIGWVALRPAIEAAYPTTFFFPEVPYDAASIARAAPVYAENCAACHGAAGRGDGPAASSLPIRPADLLAPHIFAHTPGDLFWWISHGRDDGVMPGFGEVLSDDERWDLVNYVRGRAAAAEASEVAAKVGPAPAPPFPDFAFEMGGQQRTLRAFTASGPVLLVLFASRPPGPGFAQLAGAEGRLRSLGLTLLAVATGNPVLPAEGADLASFDFNAIVSPEVASFLGLFRAAGDGAETELLIDEAGHVRARWTANAPPGLPDATVLSNELGRLAQFPSASPGHEGHAH